MRFNSVAILALLLTLWNVEPAQAQVGAKATASDSGGWPGTPVEQFRALTSTKLGMCRLFQQASFMGSTSADSLARGCVDKTKAEAVPVFKKASAQLVKKPVSLRLLKEYYANWLTAISGIEPVFDERRTTYDTRQATATQQLETAWNRFYIEWGGK